MAAISAKDSGDLAPKLAASCEPSSLDLSPVEGFLLSRIDGTTPWKLLREIGGLSPSEVDERLERWADQGWIELADAKARESARPRAKKVLAPGEIDEAELDESLDLDIETQRRILEFESKVSASYHELLGVEHGADTKDIKKAYFKLSKEFHPDRYFRKEIGVLLQEASNVIFKRVLEAYELLSDPAVRAEVEKSMAAAAERSRPRRLLRPRGPTPRRPVPPRAAHQARAAACPHALQAARILPGRTPATAPASSGRQRRPHVVKIGRSCRRRLRPMRLSIAFDPFNDDVPRGLRRHPGARGRDEAPKRSTAEADEAAADAGRRRRANASSAGVATLRRGTPLPTAPARLE